MIRANFTTSNDVCSLQYQPVDNYNGDAVFTVQYEPPNSYKPRYRYANHVTVTLTTLPLR